MFPLLLPLLVLLTTLLPFSTPHLIQPRQSSSSLRPGSYLFTWTSANANGITYKGPLRITSTDTSTFITGDLYNGTVQPNPADGSPILPRDNYFAFLRGTKLASSGNGGFTLDWEYYRFKGITRKLAINSTEWDETEPFAKFVVSLTRATAPSGFPDAQNYFEGTVTSAATGAAAGRFTLGWVSPFTRRIALEIGKVRDVPLPLVDTSGTRDWATVLADAGWHLTLEIGNQAIPEPAGANGKWSNEQEHAAVLQQRRPTDFDREWRYYLLVVRTLADVARGAMIDDNGRYNSIPREGTALACHWIVGTTVDGANDTRVPWPAAVRGKQFVELHDAWYRTALHEVGHFFNLVHPDEFQGDLMTDTDSYAFAGHDGVTEKEFPDNVDVKSFEFSESNKFLMAHRPDTHVRPGFAQFGAATQDNVPPVAVNVRA